MDSEPRIQLTEPVLLTDDPTVHFGFPRMVRARNGDLLLFYRVGTTHAYDDGIIGMRISSDGGRTWSDQRVLWSVEPGASAQNVVALVAPSGRVVLWTSRYEYGPRVRHPCWWSSSEDHGGTWAPFVVFDSSKDHNCYYVTEAINTSDGSLAGDATFPSTGIGPCHTRIWHSADEGRTWTVRSRLTEPAENRGDEIALMEIRPGTLLCILRDRRRGDVFRFWSYDAGRTWSARESIRDMLDCVLQRPFLTRLGERTMLLTGRDYERRLVVAYLSRDNGGTFAHRTELDSYQQDGAYTTAIPTGPMRCLIAWYSDSHTVPLKPDIKLATVNVME